MKVWSVSCLAAMVLVWGASGLSAQEWPQPLMAPVAGGWPGPAMDPSMLPPHPPQPWAPYGRYPYGSCIGCEPQWYTSLLGGLSITGGLSGRGPGFTFDSESTPGPAVGIAVGRTKSPSIYGRSRMELEYVFRYNAPESVIVTGVPRGASGAFCTSTFMANALWDFKGQDSVLYPYLGAGAGLAIIGSNVRYGNNRLDGVSLRPAAQLMGGLVYQWRPDIHLFTDTRFVFARSPEFDLLVRDPDPWFDAPTPGTARVRTRFCNISLMFGVTFVLGPNRTQTSGWGFNPALP